MIRPEIKSTLDAVRLLVLLPGYCAPNQGEPFIDGGRVANWSANRLSAWRGANVASQVRLHRDFYANPRTPSYMAALAGELVGRSRIGTAVALVDPAAGLTAADIPWAAQFSVSVGSLRYAAVADSIISSCDAVLLLHSDPLGLGLGRLESALLRNHPSRTFILNGRRRLYRLNAPMSRVLRRHRILAETRVVESVLAKLVGPVAGMLALLDRLGLKRT